VNWFTRRFEEPNRRQVCDAINALPRLPEWDRMRTRTMETRKPQSLEEWHAKYPRSA
jgi:hypothetical protein